MDRGGWGRRAGQGMGMGGELTENDDLRCAPDATPGRWRESEWGKGLGYRGIKVWVGSCGAVVAVVCIVCQHQAGLGRKPRSGRGV